MGPSVSWFGVFKLNEEVVEVMVDFLRDPRGRVENRVCQVDVAYDPIVDSINAGEDVASGNMMTVEEFEAIGGGRHWFVSELEGVLGELDTLTDVVVHVINLGDQIVRFDP